MLKQEHHEEQAAAKVRVTPEELAAAISRIEARKDADQRQASGTLPIGEAVQQLGLDMTPEDILAEVQAGHAITPKRRDALWDRLWGISSVGLVLCGAAVMLSLDSPARDTPATPTATFTASTGDTPHHIRLDPDLLVGDASDKVIMFSEVGDNHPVRCTFENQAIAFGPYSPGNTQSLWTLMKHEGQVYVRGRVTRMSPKVFSSSGADVTSVNSDARFSVKVTLPLHGFVVPPNVGSEAEFHATNIHLDKHAYEKWQP